MSYKKYKNNDLEILDYNHSKLINIITRKDKDLKCPKCNKVKDLSTLNTYEIYSGQYGIYYKCSSCSGNISLIVKIDLEEDEKLNTLDSQIKEFQHYLKYIKNNYDVLLSKLNEAYVEDERSKAFRFLEKNYQTDKKNLRGELNRLVVKWERFSDGKSAGDTLKAILGIKPDTTEMYYEKEMCFVKNEDVDQFNLIKKKIERLRVKNIDDYIGINRKYPEKVLSEKEDCFFQWSRWGKPNPNNHKDLEKLENEYFNPLINEKEKRILLLRKIFRSTKGSIYVLETEAMPNFYKVGWTERSPEERAKELSGTGLPTPYRVIYSQSTNLTGEVEKEIHKKLDEFRHRSNREFFKGDLELIKKTIKETLTS